MKIVTLANDFHNVVTTLRPKNGRLSARQVKKVRKALCGIAGCCCGDALGRRGPQENEIEVLIDSRTGEVTGALVCGGN